MICFIVGAKWRDVNLDQIGFTVQESDLGTIVIVVKDSRLVSIDVSKEPILTIQKQMRAVYPQGTESATIFKTLLPMIDLYLRGNKVEFAIDLDWNGLSEFGRSVLEETRKIPYGRVSTYGSLGRRLGYTNAARAVGQALGRNPFPLVVPCHRVLRGDGTLGGFSMGLGLKEKLLSLEGVSLGRVQDFLFR
jgi:methylated-DNA-[protein]-cysteine S-methyltransferase